ncbi:hypothetical protein BDV28DRAFT_116896 [Aspergillus coremiiformis]|uniref:Uncharacterized protein n=1 Tax=Aspergillus coremiiformis TaxID=138285 RepID=A0A5N6ZF38_9EURO|nr:hypothetical protein BDV28DRAFT_116896 [Aspergillus coremiiformis]
MRVSLAVAVLSLAVAVLSGGTNPQAPPLGNNPFQALADTDGPSDSAGSAPGSVPGSRPGSPPANPPANPPGDRAQKRPVRPRPSPTTITIDNQQVTSAAINLHSFHPSYSVKCGKITIQGEDIERAISLGAGLTRANKKLHIFPHRFVNIERFRLYHPTCYKPTNGVSRQEFPIVKDGYYDGTYENVYKFRVIYLYDPKMRPDVHGRVQAFYCGTVYHTTANEFEGCDVQKAPGPKV